MRILRAVVLVVLLGSCGSKRIDLLEAHVLDLQGRLSAVEQELRAMRAERARGEQGSAAPTR